MAENTEQSPLTEAVYYILLSLYEPRHGYGIMQYIKEISNNRVSLGAGTLYGAINTLLAKGWIEPVIDKADSRKKDYQITRLGKEIIQTEIMRLEELIENGKRINRGDKG